MTWSNPIWSLWKCPLTTVSIGLGSMLQFQSQPIHRDCVNPLKKTGLPWSHQKDTEIRVGFSQVQLERSFDSQSLGYSWLNARRKDPTSTCRSQAEFARLAVRKKLAFSELNMVDMESEKHKQKTPQYQFVKITFQCRTAI